MDEQFQNQVQKARQYQQRLQQINLKLAELRAEIMEYDRVRSTLSSVEQRENRTCYRLKGEVLVQSQINNVLQELEVETESIKNTMMNLEKQRVECETFILETLKKTREVNKPGSSSSSLEIKSHS
jgi:chaperonin cofactor prefoldin